MFGWLSPVFWGEKIFIRKQLEIVDVYGHAFLRASVIESLIKLCERSENLFSEQITPVIKEILAEKQLNELKAEEFLLMVKLQDKFPV